MILRGKKGQLEDFFDDLIAFGLLAIALLSFILYFAFINHATEASFEEAKDLLSCNEALAEFLQGTTTIRGEEITRYELATKIGDDAYKDLFKQEVKEYPSFAGKSWFIVTPEGGFEEEPGDIFTVTVGGIIQLNENLKQTCKATTYLPLNEIYEGASYIKIFLRSQ